MVRILVLFIILLLECVVVRLAQSADGNLDTNCYFYKENKNKIFYKTDTFFGNYILVPSVKYLTLGKKKYTQAFGAKENIEAKPEELSNTTCPTILDDPKKYEKLIVDFKSSVREKERRMRVYKELVGAEIRASKEAHKMYPSNIPRNLQANMDKDEELMKRYRRIIRKRHK